MAYIYSNSKEFIERKKDTEKAKEEKKYVTVLSKGKTRSCAIIVSSALAREIGLGRYAIIGYDKDLRRLLIQPVNTPNGAIIVGKTDGKCEQDLYRQITITSLLTYCQAEFPKIGRYKAAVAIDKTYAEVYFDLPLERKERVGR